MKTIIYKPLIFLFFISLNTNLFAQQTISGQVTDAGGQALTAAHVAVVGTNLGAVTNNDGTFRIVGIPSGQITLLISHIGFETKRVQFHANDMASMSFHFSLVRSYTMPQIEIIGRSPERFERIPGSASIIASETLQRMSPVSGADALRIIPGIFVVDQDPLGLRANIGIRGLDPSVSRNVLILEDGIPVALAPYGEPEMYYSPAINRMEGIEILKGSGSILYGPQTFGGVINFITADPPSEPGGNVHIRGGEGRYLIGRATYGNTVGRSGYTVTYLHKGGDDVAGLGYDIHDLSGKVKLVLGDQSLLGLKLGFYNEVSNATYVGLSQAMFDSGNFDFFTLGDTDQLEVRRYSGSISHDYFFSDNFRVRTTAFGYTTTRNWSREDFDNVFNPDREYARIVGNPSIPGGAIYFRGTTGNRNRSFEVAGIEPRFSLNFTTAGLRNEMDFGARFLYERAFEQRIDGITTTAPTSGRLRDDEIRTGYAYSAYLQNRTFLSNQFSVTPGIRLEHFVYERNILLLNFEPVGITSRDATTSFIPGIGLNYILREGTSLYAGVHRGFGPPRVKDAISSDGISEELDAEFSWNYEVGARSIINDILAAELTLFHMDFSNQIIPVAEAAGGQGATGTASLVNGGETRHTGIEAAIDINVSSLLETWGLGFTGSVTYTKAEFSSDRFVVSSGESVNVKGNALPYAPETTLSAGMNLTSPFGLLMDFRATYVGEHFTDVLNSTEPSLNGRSGIIPSYFILDASANYQMRSLNSLSLNVSAKNLMNERYILSRRPQGIRVGLPRFITFGIDYTF